MQIYSILSEISNKKIDKIVKNKSFGNMAVVK